ncbi:MAG: ROK family protein, partial [Propionibacteriaceae bacterium]|nr:ROK family protein [Propionibacteriaceae bacterium]
MVQDLRMLNRGTLLAELLRSRPTSRKQLALATGISPATVTRVVAGLKAEGVLREIEEVVVDARGRREMLLDLVTERELVVGVDLGASNTRVLLADLAGNPFSVHAQPTQKELDAKSLGLWAAQAVLDAAGGAFERASRIVLVVPGAVSRPTQHITNAPNLPQLEEPVFLDAVSGKLGKPVVLENDANA